MEREGEVEQVVGAHHSDARQRCDRVPVRHAQPPWVCPPFPEWTTHPNPPPSGSGSVLSPASQMPSLCCPVGGRRPPRERAKPRANAGRRQATPSDARRLSSL